MKCRRAIYMRKNRWICLFVCVCFCCSLCFSAVAGTTYNEALRLAIPGDIDGDSAVTTTDARLILQRAVGKIGSGDFDFSLADLDGDQAVTSTDARIALQISVAKSESFRPSSLPYKKLSAPPEGEAVGFIPGQRARICGDYRWMDDSNTFVHIVQTAEEWQYLHSYYAAMRDGDDTVCDLGSYDAAFFEKNALVVGDMRMSALQWTMEIKQICRNGDALEVHLRRFYMYEEYHGESEALSRRVAVAEIPKSALDGADTLAVYVQQDAAPL